MTSAWILVFRQQYSENTAEYGFGDYPEQIPYIGAVVLADTKRKAQNAVKKIFPNVTFGGMFSPMLIESTDESAKLYTKPADKRLSAERQERHREFVEDLNEKARQDRLRKENA